MIEVPQRQYHINDIGNLLERINNKLDQLLENKRGKLFQKPSQDDIYNFALSSEIENPYDFAVKFFNFYESKGWKVGKSPMKDWKAAVRTWQKKSGVQIKKPVEVSEVDRRSRYIAEDILDKAPGDTFWESHLVSKYKKLDEHWKQFVDSRLRDGQKQWFQLSKDNDGD